PVTVSVQNVQSLSSASTQLSIRLTRSGNMGSALEVPLTLADANGKLTAFSLSGSPEENIRQVVRFARGETEKIVPIVPRIGVPMSASLRAQVEILPQVQFSINQGSVEVILEGTATPSDYAVWAAAKFPAGADTALIEPGADYDNDGVSNLAEFTFGTDPT